MIGGFDQEFGAFSTMCLWSEIPLKDDDFFFSDDFNAMRVRERA